MKLMIASDLHGSLYYVNCLIERLREEKPARLLLLGDLLYHGPRNDLPPLYDTKGTAALLNSITPPPLAIRGNCDGEVDQMMLSFPMLSDTAWVFADGYTLCLTHGHHSENDERMSTEGDIILSGHTHVPAFRKENGRFYVNPGSVSIPKEGSEPSYLLYEAGVLQWKNVESGQLFREENII